MAKPWHHDKRSAAERGYGHQWRKLRLKILERDAHLCRCEDCRASGLMTPATQVDHVVSKAEWLRRFGALDGVDAPSNLRAINAQCHERKGLREKGLTVKAGADASGLPLDPGHPWNQGPGGVVSS